MEQAAQSNKKKNKKPKKSNYFLVLMLTAYGVLYLIDPDKTTSAMVYVLGILKDIVPILVLIYVFMLLLSFIHEKKLRSTIEKSPMLLKYVMMSILGTLSHGPIYAWYPFLNTLHEKGVTKGHVASFLYARGIKLTLIPMLVSFFDFKFAIILTAVTFLFAIVEGILIDLQGVKRH